MNAVVFNLGADPASQVGARCRIVVGVGAVGACSNEARNWDQFYPSTYVTGKQPLAGCLAFGPAF